METNNELEKISMMIITYSGIAKSSAIQAMDNAEKGLPFIELLEESENNLKEAHKEHFKAIQKDAEKGIKMDILFIHAEDQMSSAETILIMTRRITKLYEKRK